MIRNQNSPDTLSSHSSLASFDEKRKQLRREVDRATDAFRVRLILTAAVVFLLGIYAGIEMEKRNARNIDLHRNHSIAREVN